MSLTVVVKEATNVPNPETFGKCDPYAAVEFQGVKKKTEVQKGDTNPKWNQPLEFELVGNGISSSDELTITIFDWERVGRNRQLATAKLPLGDFAKGGDKDKDVPLLDSNQRPIAACVIKLHITCKQPPGAGGSQGGKTDGTVVDFEGDEEEEDEDEVDGGGDAADGLEGKSKRKAKKRKRKSRKIRPQLSTKNVDQQCLRQAMPLKMFKKNKKEGGSGTPGSESGVSNADEGGDNKGSKSDSSGDKKKGDKKTDSPSKDNIGLDASCGRSIGVKNPEKKGWDKFDQSKPIDFQIRVKVVQARQLNGSNLQPVVRVSIQNQLKQTRIKKSTTSPWWDESFFFNFHTPPAELVDEIVDFSVYNARTLRSDALIGSFKCDVGLIYDEDQHALVNKWVLLSDPEDPTSGAKGYLKISACVLGPGDVSPNMQAKANDEDEDIESNLLRPAGVQLRPATFALRLYCAEDIPRMDSAFLEGVKKVFGMGDDQKEFVDPYFIFSFAGKEIRSKIMYSNDHPDWYQELRIGLQFPSMCERIKLQIRDWDRLTDDDTVGTVFLPVSTISAAGEADKDEENKDDGEDNDSYRDDFDLEEYKRLKKARVNGYLPTFGPSYVNLYGSTREYSDLPDDYDDLNLGKGEGVAYRGRALVELVTTLGEVPEIAVEDIPGDDKLRVQKFMRRRKYRVHAAFLTASMISSNHVDGPIEFEISIGNYGNKLEENVPPSPSTTQPTNAVFDGCYYYFLPWGGSKPCVVVDSSWEDISFRLESLNILLSIIERLEANIERVRIGIKAKLPMPELAQLLISLLDQLIVDCDVKLIEPKDGQHVANELDRLMKSVREDTLANIKKSSKNLRESATNIDEALSEVENMAAMLRNCATEPQNSMPDVVIWMISGQKRIAYYRIPAYELLYSDNKNGRGKSCGKLMSIPLKYPQTKDKDKKNDIPTLLRIKLWLGLQTQEHAWHKMQTEGELAVYAETYENQVNILGTWTNKGPTMTRPKYSDSEGRIELQKDDFKPPPGWQWEGEWYVSPELSMLYDKDAGHRTYLDEVYECHSRNIPGGGWGAASRPWSDVKGDPCQDKASIPLPEGWKWDDDWQIDLNRAVDEEGWEYCVEATVGGYGPVERTYHLCRRRRWLRPRTSVQKQDSKKKLEAQKKKQVEGWEYAPLFNMKFHAIERTMDLVRRRRWHRKMISTGKGEACFFNVAHESSGDSEKEMKKLATMAAPRMFLTHKTSHKYQLRSYIYQARDLLAADDSGLSDPFARISFMRQSMVTEKVEKTLCPTWDQTLIFVEIEIYGDPKAMEITPPEIYIELFDYDTFGKPEFLGRSCAQPMVKLDPGDARTPVLQWYIIDRLGQDGGELLAAFELIKIPDDAFTTEIDETPQVSPETKEITGKDMPFLPPKRGELFIVPNGIRPVMQRTAIEVLCWGVRNMSKFQLSAVTSPSVRFECGGHVKDSPLIKDTRRNPNFPENVLFFDVMLPKEELYMPPMNIRVKDHRQFGRKPTVGVHVLKSLEEFRVDPSAEVEKAQAVALPGPPNGDGIDSMDISMAMSDGAGAGPGPDGRGGKGKKKGAEEKVPLQPGASTSGPEVIPPAPEEPAPVPETIIEMPPEGDKVDKKKKSRLQKFKGMLHVKKNLGAATDSAPPVVLASDEKDTNNSSIFQFGKASKDKLKKIKKVEYVIPEESELTALELDWWSKYYASTNDLDKCKKYTALGYDTLQLLTTELEKSETYGEFSDFCHTFHLTRGKQDDDEDDNVIGEFKGAFRVYPLPADPSEPLPTRIFETLPCSDPEECIVRVYIIKAVDLQPGDPNGLADPYLEVQLGKKKMNTRDNYIPNSINPVFGRLFEMKCLIPISKDLTIRVKDYDLLSADDTVGETVIDLENRCLSKFRATVGLPKTYWVSGINQWRDGQKPLDLLKEFCQRFRMEGPIFNRPMNVRVGSQVFKLTDFEPKKPTNPHLGPEDQRLALHVLNQFPLVKEHIESRPLFNPLQPNIEQGRLQMWVDVFPTSLGAPGLPFDVEPRKPSKYQLRVIIWNTKDVILEEESITGEKMSDIYVQGWMAGIDEKEKTDVHYRSLDGEGNFNWRFVFPFEYQVAEETVVVKKKEHFWSLDETEIRTAPKFIVQIWDNDKFSKDDFIGHLELNLSALPLPAKRSRSCKLNMLPDATGKRNVKLASLFDLKRLYGYWPCYDETSGERVLTGKIEMELELVSGDDSVARPAGQGRDEPNMHPTLEPPKRPETSFLWFTSPWKTLKFVIWRNYRCCILMTILILLCILMVGLFIYSFPENITRLILGT